MSIGSISYIEIGGGARTEASGAFFSKLFGWQYKAMGDAGNGWFQLPDIKAGLHPNDLGFGIFPFFEVADLSEAVTKVRELGGEASDPGPAEPGFGRFSFCSDPDGIKFGLHVRTDA